MKIIAVIGSPKRNGSGFKIVKMIEDRMKKLGEVEFEYIFLREANLLSCTGCYTCMAKGEDRCPLKDDRELFEKKFLNANGIILSSPVHVNNVSSLMKNFVDRFAYANHRPRFHRQKILSVVNSSGNEKKAALSFLRSTLGGSRVVSELGVATPPWLQTEKAIAKKEKAIGEASKKFYRACLDTSLPSPTFSDYFLFYIYQKLGSECRQYLPADYEYYKDKSYFYSTNSLSLLKRAVAKLIVKIMMAIWLKNMGPGDLVWPKLNLMESEAG